MDSWEFAAGAFRVSKVRPDCSEEFLEQLEQVQSDFVEHHWRLYGRAPDAMRAEDKAACVAKWAEELGAINMRRRLQSTTIFLALQGGSGKVLGYTSFRFRPAAADWPDHTKIYHLAVAKALQLKRTGAGKSLFNAVVAFAREYYPNSLQLRLSAADLNKKVLVWYQKRLGFKGPPLSREKKVMYFPVAGERCEFRYKALTLDLAPVALVTPLAPWPIAVGAPAVATIAHHQAAPEAAAPEAAEPEAPPALEAEAPLVPEALAAEPQERFASPTTRPRPEHGSPLPATPVRRRLTGKQPAPGSSTPTLTPPKPQAAEAVWPGAKKKRPAELDQEPVEPPKKRRAKPSAPPAEPNPDSWSKKRAFAAEGPEHGSGKRQRVCASTMGPEKAEKASKTPAREAARCRLSQ